MRNLRPTSCTSTLGTCTREINSQTSSFENQWSLCPGDTKGYEKETQLLKTSCIDLSTTGLSAEQAGWKVPRQYVKKISLANLKASATGEGGLLELSGDRSTGGHHPALILLAMLSLPYCFPMFHPDIPGGPTLVQGPPWCRALLWPWYAKCNG